MLWHLPGQPSPFLLPSHARLQARYSRRSLLLVAGASASMIDPTDLLLFDNVRQKPSYPRTNRRVSVTIASERVCCCYVIVQSHSIIRNESDAIIPHLCYTCSFSRFHLQVDTNPSNRKRLKCPICTIFLKTSSPSSFNTFKTNPAGIRPITHA